jgi:acetate CoA/acetoacetate CoA-transferase beta subunit
MNWLNATARPTGCDFPRVVPDSMILGMAGALSLVAGTRRVIVAMARRSRSGSKVVKRCSLPITSLQRADVVVSELAVVGFTSAGFVLQHTEAILILSPGPGI